MVPTSFPGPSRRIKAICASPGAGRSPSMGQQNHGGSISFGGSNYGQVASGRHFSQEQTVNNAPSVEHLRELLIGLAEIVALAVPDQANEARRQGR